MLRLPPFRFVAPITLDEVLIHLTDIGERAALMAGGTDLLPHLKRRQRRPELVVSLRRVPEVQGISVGSEGARIGAGATLAALSRHPAIRQQYPFLAAAIETIAAPTLREMGTIGGNLCIETRCTYFDLPPHSRLATGGCLKDGVPVCLAAPRSARCRAVASSDAAPLLIALGARVRLASGSGERVIPLPELYQDDGLRPLRLRSDEVVVELFLPPPDGLHAAYHKIRRRGTLDFAAASAAVAFRIGQNGMLREARVVVGAVASAPLIVVGAARVLEGSPLEAERVHQAAAAAGRAARPIDNGDLTAGWRRRMVEVATVRALGAAARPIVGSAA